MKRKIVALCGSLRHWHEIQKAAERLALEKGWVILQPVAHVLDRALTSEEKTLLGQLHRSKINLADAVYVVNIGGYIGDAVRSEIAYAMEKGKEILYLEEPYEP